MDFRQFDDSATTQFSDHLSPAFRPGRFAVCAECGRTGAGLYRWRWTSSRDKRIVCAAHVSSAEWSARLRAGEALRFPEPEKRRANVVSFEGVRHAEQSDTGQLQAA